MPSARALGPDWAQVRRSDSFHAIDSRPVWWTGPEAGERCGWSSPTAAVASAREAAPTSISTAPPLGEGRVGATPTGDLLRRRDHRHRSRLRHPRQATTTPPRTAPSPTASAGCRSTSAKMPKTPTPPASPQKSAAALAVALQQGTRTRPRPSASQAFGDTPSRRDGLGQSPVPGSGSTEPTVTASAHWRIARLGGAFRVNPPGALRCPLKGPLSEWLNSDVTPGTFREHLRLTDRRARAVDRQENRPTFTGWSGYPTHLVVCDRDGMTVRAADHRDTTSVRAGGQLCRLPPARAWRSATR